jgi:hypothetical protein
MLSRSKPTSETGTLVVRFGVRSVDETFALLMVFLLERCIFTRCGCWYICNNRGESSYLYLPTSRES